MKFAEDKELHRVVHDLAMAFVGGRVANPAIREMYSQKELAKQMVDEYIRVYRQIQARLQEE